MSNLKQSYKYEALKYQWPNYLASNRLKNTYTGLHVPVFLTHELTHSWYNTKKYTFVMLGC